MVAPTVSCEICGARLSRVISYLRDAAGLRRLGVIAEGHLGPGHVVWVAIKSVSWTAVAVCEKVPYLIL